MRITRCHLTIVTALLLFFLSRPDTGEAQSSGSQQRRSASATCPLNGTYRINVPDSDRLYSVVRGARSTVPFAEQQKFFIDMSVRLTPPDMIAIECRGQQVSVGSSRAAKITYLADGRNRRERLPNGGFVNSKITLDPNALTFVSVGNVDDNVNVSFQSTDGGRRMLVTRRIYASQLTEPIVIRTSYDKVSSDVRWDMYEGDLVADANPNPGSVDPPSGANGTNQRAADILRGELTAWIAATNQRNIDAQMRFYMPRLRAYYLSRDTPFRSVRLEKERIFTNARVVDIRAGEPEIIFQDDERTAIMRFVKNYRIVDRSRGTKQGSVIQELRWQRTPDGWRIFSERDVRVLR